MAPDLVTNISQKGRPTSLCENGFWEPIQDQQSLGGPLLILLRKRNVCESKAALRVVGQQDGLSRAHSPRVAVRRSACTFVPVSGTAPDSALTSRDSGNNGRDAPTVLTGCSWAWQGQSTPCKVNWRRFPE
jgi:hypothetical protein